MLSSSLSNPRFHVSPGVLALLNRCINTVNSSPRVGLLTIETPRDVLILLASLISVPQLCELLSISRATLYREIKAGQIEVTRLRTRTLFTEAAVSRYIKRQQTKAAEAEVGF